MIRRPPRSTQSRSSAASDVYKRQGLQSLLPRTSRSLRDVHSERPSPHSTHRGDRYSYAAVAQADTETFFCSQTTHTPNRTLLVDTMIHDFYDQYASFVPSQEGDYSDVGLYIRLSAAQTSQVTHSALVPYPRLIFCKEPNTCSKPHFTQRLASSRPVSYTHLTLPTIYSV